MDDSIHDFRDLVVWQRSIELAKEVYTQSKRFPADERFGLTSQIRRAAVSVSSNIAEGHARAGREFAHFLSVARGSLAEVESQCALAIELGYLDRADSEVTHALANEIHRMIASLRAKLIARQSPER